MIGLGILGQLTVQMLKANGCKVIGADVKPARIERALESGMDASIHPGDGDPVSRVARLTDGFGADGAIITAATPADDAVATAFQVCRKKGRVVLVGDVGLNLDRGDLYVKELDFLISTSYGPGRYERRYEEEGLDYPLAYVRWTENRNMAEYLRLLDEEKVRLGHCIDSVYPLADANQAYDALSDQERRPLMVVLRYPLRDQDQMPRRRTDNPRARPSSSGRIRMALVGAGSATRSLHR